MDISMRKPRNGERGFTLIELMVILVVIGVLAAVATAGYMYSRPCSIPMEGLASGAIRTVDDSYWNRFVKYVDPCFVEREPYASEERPAPSPDGSAPSTLPPGTPETSAPPTMKPRATVRPTRSTDAGVPLINTPSPTPDTAPGVEPPHRGPPDSG